MRGLQLLLAFCCVANIGLIAQADEVATYTLTSGVAAGRTYIWDIQTRELLTGEKTLRARARLKNFSGLPKDFLEDYGRLGSLAQVDGTFENGGRTLLRIYHDISEAHGAGLYSSSFEEIAKEFPKIDHIYIPSLANGNMRALGVEGEELLKIENVAKTPLHKILSGRLGWVGMGRVVGVRRNELGVAQSVEVELHWFKPGSRSLQKGLQLASKRGWVILPQYDRVLGDAVEVAPVVLKFAAAAGNFVRIIRPLAKATVVLGIALGGVFVIVDVCNGDTDQAYIDLVNTISPIPVMNKNMMTHEKVKGPSCHSTARTLPSQMIPAHEEVRR